MSREIGSSSEAHTAYLQVLLHVSLCAAALVFFLRSIDTRVALQVLFQVRDKDIKNTLTLWSN
jgi:hypothetical protein